MMNPHQPPAATRAAGLLAAALILTLAACSKAPVAPEAASKVAWITATVSDGADASYTGVVHARTESTLGFRVGGKIVARLADPGDQVRQGQPLMKLDASDFVLANAAARAAVDAALARQVQTAAEEARLRRLVDAGMVSANAYGVAKAAADSAAAQLGAERARARQTEHQSEYALLLADADGVVMEVPVEPGQVVAAGQTVVKLARNGAREALVNLPETALAQARHPATARLYGDAASDYPLTLRELSAVAEPQTRTYAARYALGGAGAQAPLGATVTVRLENAGQDAAEVSVPLGALVDKGQGPGVWVIAASSSSVHFRAVKVARLGEESARLASGLAPGERVVAFGAHLLREGQKVEPLAATKGGARS
ncbi:MAG: efflux RND transporter periplasmic adaptor subunit [Pseudomonadota bacterium]